MGTAALHKSSCPSRTWRGKSRWDGRDPSAICKSGTGPDMPVSYSTHKGGHLRPCNNAAILRLMQEQPTKPGGKKIKIKIKATNWKELACHHCRKTNIENSVTQLKEITTNKTELCNSFRPDNFGFSLLNSRQTSF